MLSQRLALEENASARLQSAPGLVKPTLGAAASTRGPAAGPALLKPANPNAPAASGPTKLGAAPARRAFGEITANTAPAPAAAPAGGKKGVLAKAPPPQAESAPVKAQVQTRARAARAVAAPPVFVAEDFATVELVHGSDVFPMANGAPFESM